MSRNASAHLPLLGLLLAVLTLLTLMVALPAQAADADWHARYWNNRKLSGEPVLQRFEPQIDNDWGSGYPAPGVDSDNFSAKWTRNVELPAGTYRFIATADDGIRVWIDEVLLIDSWYDSQERTISADRALGPGNHFIRVEYYEAGGDAVARFSWVPIGGGPVTFNNWKGEYFNNSVLRAPALFLRDDPAINFDWGFNAPIAGFSADNFSVRWTRDLALNPGTYRFSVLSDDGVRLWVNNTLIIDEWQKQADARFTADVTVPGGPTPVKVEYFDARDRAVIQVNWAPIGGSGQPVPPAGRPTPTTPPSGLTATMTGALYLNVRNTPALDGTVVDTLSRGQTVRMTGYKSVGGYWIEIVLPDGQTGWASTRYMTTGVPVTDLPVKR
jgi:hypothetical protein